MLPPATSSDYVGVLQRLAPPGRLWRAVSKLLAIFEGLAHEGERAHALVVKAWNELFPGTAVDMLPEWEALLGLPDPIAPAPVTLSDRQAAAAGKFAARGGQSAPYYRAVAAALGVAIVIDDAPRVTFRADFSHADDRLWSEYDVFVWQVSGPAATDADLQDRLEALFERIKPGHTFILWSWTL